jgi:hypothetical protein
MNFKCVPYLAGLALLIGGCDRDKITTEGGPRPPATPGSETEAFGRNLLTNGDAETLQLTDKAGEKDIPATWSRALDVLAVEYGSVTEEWASGKPGCPDGRKRYFRLALAINEESKAISQNLNVTFAASDIAAGKVECALGGWFGGWSGGDASAKLEVVFRGANDEKIGTLSTEAPDPAALPKTESGKATLVKQIAVEVVPAGTRRVEARLVAVRKTPNIDTNAVAAADNLSIVLRKKESASP